MDIGKEQEVIEVAEPGREQQVEQPTRREVELPEPVAPEPDKVGV